MARRIPALAALFLVVIIGIAAAVIAHPAAPARASFASGPPAVLYPTEVECRVPKLNGKTLMQVKRLLANANCRLGVVTHRRAPQGGKAGPWRGRVIRARPPAGSRAPANAKVRVRLG